MSALEKMAKAACRDCPGCGDDGGCWDDMNRLAKNLLDALISHLKAGAPELVEAHYKAAAKVAEETPWNDGPIKMIAFEKLSEAQKEVINAGLIAALEKAKGEK